MCAKKEAEAGKSIVFSIGKQLREKKKSWRPTSSTYFVFEVSPLSTDLPLLSLADHPVMLSFGKEIPGAN